MTISRACGSYDYLISCQNLCSSLGFTAGAAIMPIYAYSSVSRRCVTYCFVCLQHSVAPCGTLWNSTALHACRKHKILWKEQVRYLPVYRTSSFTDYKRPFNLLLPSLIVSVVISAAAVVPIETSSNRHPYLPTLAIDELL